MSVLFVSAVVAFTFAALTPHDGATVAMFALGAVSLSGAFFVRVRPDRDDSTYVHDRTFHAYHRGRDRSHELPRAARHHLEEPTE